MDEDTIHFILIFENSATTLVLCFSPFYYYDPQPRKLPFFLYQSSIPHPHQNLEDPDAMSKDYDRASEIKAFDATKFGVKGLIDAGITSIPRIFLNPIGPIPSPDPQPVEIPIIDLRDVKQRFGEIALEVGRSSEEFGFFQVINHGIPVSVLEGMMDGVRRFNEQPTEVRVGYYTREQGRRVVFNSNFDLYRSAAANWRDSLLCVMGTEPPKPEEFPAACRDIIIEYSAHIKVLGNILFKLLSVALGLDCGHLKEMECALGLSIAAHYYPSCPQPHLTLGTTKHSDPSFLTILLQDQIGGLQVLYKDHWVDVVPIPGALVVNIGDLLQLISNDKLKSVEHRVLAKKAGPRISVACFFVDQLFTSPRLYGPIKELLSQENPALYKEIQIRDFITYYNSRGLGGPSALNYFKL